MVTKDLTTQQVSNKTQKDRLLNAEERTICEQIAIGETLDSQRAQALLIVDDGATQAEAGEQSGLTLYQVKYCLTRYRKLGMAMFPPVAPAAAQPDSDLASEPVPKPLPGTDEAETGTEKPINKPGNKASKAKKSKGKKSKKKRNKSKQGKGRKKSKKAKSGKSTKKSRKKKGVRKSKKKSAKPKKKKGGGKKGSSKSGKSSRKKDKR